jgi:hypothetical protein
VSKYFSAEFSVMASEVDGRDPGGRGQDPPGWLSRDALADGVRLAGSGDAAHELARRLDGAMRAGVHVQLGVQRGGWVVLDCLVSACNRTRPASLFPPAP